MKRGQDRRGRLVGIEVKAAATIRQRDLSGLVDLSQAVGNRFLRGIILYTGRETVPFAANLHAIPVSALWWGHRPANACGGASGRSRRWLRRRRRA